MEEEPFHIESILFKSWQITIQMEMAAWKDIFTYINRGGEMSMEFFFLLPQMVSFITIASKYIRTLHRPKSTRPRASKYQSKNVHGI